MNEILLKRISDRDSKHLDPGERAELVNSFIWTALGIEDPKDAIEHPLYWDLLCWCEQMLLLFAMSVEHQELLGLMKLVQKQWMSLHYSLPDGEPELGPSKEEHEKLWTERIDYLIKRLDIEEYI
jgi:hypothetical protein